MKFPALRRAAAAVMIALPALSHSAAAQSADDFERAMQASFQAVSAGVPSGAAAPTAASPAFEAGGVFIKSSFDGRLAYCSASGCRLLLNSGAGTTVLGRSESLYFTGPAGTGYCTPSGCELLLPGVRVTFPLGVGPNGDIYGSDAHSGWHCTPDACRKASDRPLQTDVNYISGLYKPNGDFVSSSSAGTFWCSGDRCARVGDDSLLFVEESCSGRAPKRAVYGFVGQEIRRCTPEKCAPIGASEKVDNYIDCAFDAKGGLILNAREGSGGFLYNEAGVARTDMTAPADRSYGGKAIVSRTSDSALKGADGATYTLVDHNRDGKPAATPPQRLVGAVERTGRKGRVETLNFDTAMACWQWQTSDDDEDEDPSGWYNGCQLMR
jgi:hypothetical protein